MQDFISFVNTEGVGEGIVAFIALVVRYLERRAMLRKFAPHDGQGDRREGPHR